MWPFSEIGCIKVSNSRVDLYLIFTFWGTKWAVWNSPKAMPSHFQIVWSFINNWPKLECYCQSTFMYQSLLWILFMKEMDYTHNLWLKNYWKLSHSTQRKDAEKLLNILPLETHKKIENNRIILQEVIVKMAYQWMQDELFPLYFSVE